MPLMPMKKSSKASQYTNNDNKRLFSDLKGNTSSEFMPSLQKIKTESGSKVKTRYITIAFDLETTGFPKDGGSMEMVQFAAIRENGSSFNRFFMPKGDFSTGASDTNGLTVEKLRQLGAKPFTEEDAKEIAEFMPGRRQEDVPVEFETHAISHNYKHDRLQILLPAFKALAVWLPMWRHTCTEELAVNMSLKYKKFETLCEHYSVINRTPHDALSDARALMECWKLMKGGGSSLKSL